MYIFPDCSLQQIWLYLIRKKLFGAFWSPTTAIQLWTFRTFPALWTVKEYVFDKHQTEALWVETAWNRRIQFMDINPFPLSSWASEQAKEWARERSSAEQANKWSVREIEWAEEQMASISYTFYCAREQKSLRKYSFDHPSFEDVNIARFLPHPSQYRLWPSRSPIYVIYIS